MESWRIGNYEFHAESGEQIAENAVRNPKLHPSNTPPLQLSNTTCSSIGEYNLGVDRLNSEGIPRHLLTVALKDRRQVLQARRFDKCMLCRRGRVNDSGLCEVCYGSLDGEEFRLAAIWTSGVGP